MISEDELKQLEELEKKATPAPWEAYSAPCCPDMGGVSSGKRTICDDKVGNYGHPMTVENAEFIEAARNLIPRLLLAYKEQEKELEEWKDYANNWKEIHLSKMDMLSQKDTTIAKMRECLKDMVRLVEAFRYSNVLGKGQNERFEKARQCLKEVGE